MVRLDKFVRKQLTPAATCSECGDSGGCILFWQRGRTDAPPDAVLCGPCLLDADGRFKNNPPEALFKTVGSVARIYRREDTVVVETSSPLGDVSYVHYTEVSAEAQRGSFFDDDPGPDNRRPVNCALQRQLTGSADGYDEDGVHLTSHSPYAEEALRYLWAD